MSMKRTAYHEAGHAVMDHINRGAGGKLSIIPDEDTAGRWRWRTTPKRANHAAMCYAAGQVAEAIYLGHDTAEAVHARIIRTLALYESVDMEYVKELTRLSIGLGLGAEWHVNSRMTNDEWEFDKLIENVRYKLVQHDAQLAIRDVALALMEQSELEGKYLRGIINRAQGTRDQRILVETGESPEVPKPPSFSERPVRVEEGIVA